MNLDGKVAIITGGKRIGRVVAQALAARGANLVLSYRGSKKEADETVAEVVQHHAGALEVMKQMGINHCCGAHLTLREAAASAGVPLETLLTALSNDRKAPA